MIMCHQPRVLQIFYHVKNVGFRRRLCSQDTCHRRKQEHRNDRNETVRRIPVAASQHAFRSRLKVDTDQLVRALCGCVVVVVLIMLTRVWRPVASVLRAGPSVVQARFSGGCVVLPLVTILLSFKVVPRVNKIVVLQPAIFSLESMQPPP